MGVSVAEGTIVAWKKEPGDQVEADEPIVEISTDKVETEVPAPASGRLRDVLVSVGETVDVGTVLATIEVGGDGRPAEGDADGEAAARRPAGEAEPAPTAGGDSGDVEPAATAAGDGDSGERRAAEAAPRADGADGGAPPVTPVVRRMADEHSIDLSQIEGSGRRGRVTKKDVLAYLRAQEQAEGASAREEAEAAPAGEEAEAAPAAEEKPEPALHMESPYREEAPPEAAPAAAEAAPTVAEAATRPAEAAPTAAEAAPRPAEAAPPPDGGPVPQELSVMRKRIAEHMVRSVQTAAHCTTIVDADMSRIDAVRGKRSYLPFVARATIAALREHPTLNATIEGDRLTVHDAVHLGIAVSLGEEGLIVPVIRNAHELSEEGLAVRIKDLAIRARTKRLSPDEVGGGTFTITNPGAFGALLATPIINQPQVAILDLEAVVKRPVVVTDADGSDSIAIRPMTYLCMSWDHRALDGALAAQFLSTLKRRIESWSGS
jgi:pyruvate/2-oxoglutarate dehydrogenase complex dihydrolipoamide acyltransferase (E2) component